MSDSTEYVYLDVCALSRPFDDQNQMRIRLEIDAVLLILSHVRGGNLTLIVSPVHDIEIGAIEDSTEREHLVSILRDLGKRVPYDRVRTRQRAEQLVQHGLGPADAAHLAFAEAAEADFVTCDDRLLRQCRSVQASVWSGTLMAFCDKENLQ